MSLRAIVESGKGEVLANPKVLVMNNTDAEIFVGEEKYFTLLSGQASNPYYTLQSIKAGVTLKATPSIGKDGQITLKLEPEVSDVVDDGGADSISALGSASASSPVVTRRHAKTVVDIADGQTLMLGGLIRDQHRKVIDKVPGVGDVPAAGALFRKIREENVRQEIVILLTVHIIDNPVNAAEKVTSRLVGRYVTPLDALTAPVQPLVRGN
jgi:general secretion pathway protein D